jgi:hypothetical protein
MLIDTDVHNDFGDLTAYLPRVWHDRWRRVGTGAGSVHEGNPRGVLRRDADSPGGGPPASDPEFLITDHLDPAASRSDPTPTTPTRSPPPTTTA